MSVLFPASTKAQGRTSVVVVQTIASTTAPDLSSEIGAGSCGFIDLSAASAGCSVCSWS